MALTRIISELFENAGDVTSGAPAGFANVSGTFRKVGVGARISGVAAPGWSADLRLAGASNLYADFALSGAAATKGMIGAWFRFKSLPSGYCTILRLCTAAGLDQPISAVSLGSDGKLQNANLYTGAGADLITSTITLEPHKWYWIATSWEVVGFAYNFRGHIMPLGGTLTQWGAGDGLLTYASAFTGAGIAGKTGGGNLSLRASMPTVCSLGALSEIAYPTDVIAPVETPQTWHVNPDSGDDSNDGMTALTAWQTAEKINLESRWMGMIPYNVDGPGGGDVLRIDTSAAPLTLGTDTLTLLTNGIEVRPAVGEDYIDATAEKTLLAGGWSASGTANVYQTSDTQEHVVVWEDDKWLNHPIGANFAAVATALSTTPGSFWTDGTTLYLHPFGSTNPASDGKVYTRSINRNGAGAAVNMACIRYHLDGLRTQKTCLAKKDDNDALGAYCLQDSGSDNGGTAKISNSVLAYGSKHIFGSTQGSVNSTLIIEDMSAEQGSPYTGFGGQSPLVSYNGTPNAGNIHIYRRVECLKVEGLIGSTTGVSGFAFPVFLSHANSGDQYPFAELIFEDCNFPTSWIEPGEALICRITGGRINDVTTYCPTTIIDRVEWSGQGIGMAATTALNPSLAITNSLLRPVWDIDALPMYGIQAKGTLTIQGCTVDFSQITGSATYSNLIERTAALNLTFRDNLVLANEDKAWPILGTATSSDTLTFDHNAYVGTPLMARDYNDGSTTANRTLAQWQALGKDLDALALTDAEVDGDLFPEAGSPLLGAGTIRAQAYDFSGNRFLVRSSIGALELETDPGAGDSLIWTKTWPSQQVTQYVRYRVIGETEWTEEVTTFTGTTPQPTVNGRDYEDVWVAPGTRLLAYFQ